MRIARLFPQKRFTTEHPASIPECSEKVSDTPQWSGHLWGRCIQKVQSSWLNFIPFIKSPNRLSSFPDAKGMHI